MLHCKLRLGQGFSRRRVPASRRSAPRHTAASRKLASSAAAFRRLAWFFAFCPSFPLSQILPICAADAATGGGIEHDPFPSGLCACIALMGFTTPARCAFSSASSQARSYAPSKSPPSICASPGHRSQYCRMEHFEQTGNWDSRTARTRFISADRNQISSKRRSRTLPVATGICTHGNTSPYGEM